MIIVTPSAVFEKLRFHLKRKAGVFKLPRFEEHFRKVLFSWRISLDSRPSRRNKVAFSKCGRGPK